MSETTPIVLDVNYIPNHRSNWPKGFSGYICGTIPSNDASCAQPDLGNIDGDQPRTFKGCCNGDIVNITQPVTDSSNPSYGASCLAYCKVDYARTVDDGTGIGFGDYWNCLNAYSAHHLAFNNNSITGHVTCGWVNTSFHDQCSISVSVAQSYYSMSTATAAKSNGSSFPTSTASQTWPSCPADTTPTSTSTPSVTGTGGSSGGRHVHGETNNALMGTSLLFLMFGLLLCT